jgi:hypothetical protein
MTHWRQVGPHVISSWDDIFLDETQNGAKNEVSTHDRMVFGNLYH